MVYCPKNKSITLQVSNIENWVGDEMPLHPHFIHVQEIGEYYKVDREIEVITNGVFDQVIKYQALNSDEINNITGLVFDRKAIQLASLFRLHKSDEFVSCDTCKIPGVEDGCSKNWVLLANDIAKCIKAQKSQECNISLKNIKVNKLILEVFLTALLIEYMDDNRYKSKTTQPKLNWLHILVDANSDIDDDDAILEHAYTVAISTELTQQLVTSPPNKCNPTTLATACVEIAALRGLSITTLDIKDLEEAGLNLIVAVGKGSAISPRLIHMKYTNGNAKVKIAYVGKGITMDTGGYNLKVGGSSIELMKYDMAGAGAVIGAADAIGQLQPKDIEIHFIVGAAENMISEKAYRPGDIYKAGNGKTVEIMNTDAEGRLVLADCLHYACKLGVNIVVDLATLTGAIKMALGKDISGLYGNDIDTCYKMLSSARNTGESMWLMPMHSEYKNNMKGVCADLTNAGTERWGGSINAAHFLIEFIEEGVKWCHIDIAGPAFDSNKNRGSGYAVKTLIDFAIEASK